MGTTYDRVCSVLSYCLIVDKPLKPDSDLETEYGADSLDLIEISSCLEDEFGVEISFDGKKVPFTPGGITKAIEEELKVKEQNDGRLRED